MRKKIDVDDALAVSAQIIEVVRSSQTTEHVEGQMILFGTANLLNEYLARIVEDLTHEVVPRRRGWKSNEDILPDVIRRA